MLLEKDVQITKRKRIKCLSLLQINTVQDRYLKEHLLLRNLFFIEFSETTINIFFFFNSIPGRHGSGSESPRLRINTSPGPGNYETNRSTLDNHALVK